MRTINTVHVVLFLGMVCLRSLSVAEIKVQVVLVLRQGYVHEKVTQIEIAQIGHKVSI
jgi:hypothetical protein